MPTGRKQVDYTDIRPIYIPVKIDNVTIVYSATAPGGSVSVGLAVTWSANDTVALTQDGNYVLGTLISVEMDGFGTVQSGGIAKLPSGTAAAVTRGKGVVGALLAAARGYVREVNTAVAAELGVQRGSIMNNADLAAIVVDLTQ